jgi:hypothetical protein
LVGSTMLCRPLWDPTKLDRRPAPFTGARPLAGLTIRFPSSNRDVAAKSNRHLAAKSNRHLAAKKR